MSAALSGGMSVPQADSLRPVTVTSERPAAVSRTDTLSSGNSIEISDVLRKIPGVHVGDNGGLSGLKTVSLRGLGSAHTSLYVDGVRVGNVQSGQNDLGMLGLENVDQVVVDYAANSISFNTSAPEFGASSASGNIRVHAGSFSTYLPSARLALRLSDNLTLSVNGAGIISKGDYRYADGLVRTNNDISQFRGGLDLFGRMKDGEYRVKIYTNSTDRGTPGPVNWPSEDRQSDRNTFLQGRYRKGFSSVYVLDVSAKVAYDDIAYTSSWGDSCYGQTEIQLNSSHHFKVRNRMDVSALVNLQWDGLESTAYNTSRLSVLSSLGAFFRAGRFSGDAVLEYTGAFDRAALSRNVLSPALALRYKVSEDLELVAFGRRACRVPVFNELYYVGYGNPSLKPEDAIMMDAGADYKRKAGGWTIKAKADAFLNLLKNKITSVPSVEDPAVWMPYNIGKVRSAGLDVAAGFVRKGVWTLGLDARWNLNHAVDVDSSNTSYGQQIPYIARHTLVLDGSVEWKGWTLLSFWQMRSGRTDGAGALPDYDTLDLSLCRTFTLCRSYGMKVSLSCRNVFDCSYEIAGGYPMPGRTLMGGVEFSF